MTHSTYSHCFQTATTRLQKNVSYRTNVGSSSMRTNWTSLDMMNKAPPWQVHWHRLLESIQRSLQWKPTRTKVQQFAIKGASNVLKPRAGLAGSCFFWMHFDGFKTLDWKNKGQKMNQLQFGGWISHLANGICDRFFTTWVSTKKPDPGHPRYCTIFAHS